LKTFKLIKYKTLVATLILVLVAMSLGAATYSWYIVSTAPTVKAVQTYMTVIDPSLSIARATDGAKVPEEVDTQNMRNSIEGIQELEAQDEYYDITWGAIISSFQKDELKLDFPATYYDPAKTVLDKTENKDLYPSEAALATAKYGIDGRIEKLVPLTPGEMGTDLNGETQYGIRYYTREGSKDVCAVGLGVWLKINQDYKNIYAVIKDASIINGAKEKLNNDNIGIAFRVLGRADNTDNPKIYDTSDQENIIFPRATVFKASASEEEHTYHAALLFAEDGALTATKDMRPRLPADEPVLIEIIVYIEGQNNGVADATESQIGLIAKSISQGLRVNLESITFVDDEHLLEAMTHNEEIADESE